MNKEVKKIICMNVKVMTLGAYARANENEIVQSCLTHIPYLVQMLEQRPTLNMKKHIDTHSYTLEFCFAQWHTHLQTLEKNTHIVTLCFTKSHDKFVDIFTSSSTHTCAFHQHSHICITQLHICGYTFTFTHIHPPIHKPFSPTSWLSQFLCCTAKLKIWLRESDLSLWERT